jgi:hypothetical protein
MANADDYITGYLTKDDFPEEQTLIITEVKEEMVGQGDDSVQKLIVYTAHYPRRGLALNKTNTKTLKKICKSSDTDEWPGAVFVAYCNPNVVMRGKVVGGLRVREASNEEAELAKGATPF